MLRRVPFHEPHVRLVKMCDCGEVRGGKLRLEDLVLPAAVGAGLEPCLVLVNAQTFTKTANCWGVTNNQKGTNSNRIVVVRKGHDFSARVPTT